MTSNPQVTAVALGPFNQPQMYPCIVGSQKLYIFQGLGWNAYISLETGY